MKRIGRTDAGGMLIEMTGEDVIHLMQAQKSLSSLFDEVDIRIPVSINNVPEPDGKAGESSCPPPVAPRGQTAPAVSTKRMCVECGKPIFDRPTAVTCGEACAKVRDDRSKRESYLRRKKRLAKASGKKPSVKPPSASGYEPRVCRSCGKTFTPHRHDQKRCSKQCKQVRAKDPGVPATRVEQATPAAKPAATPARKPLTPEQIKANRLALLRAAAARIGMDGSQRSLIGGADSLIGDPDEEELRAVRGED